MATLLKVHRSGGDINLLGDYRINTNTEENTYYWQYSIVGKGKKPIATEDISEIHGTQFYIFLVEHKKANKV